MLKCVSVVSVGMHGIYVYHAARLYVAKQHTRDGYLYWCATSIVGPDRRGNKIVQRDAEELAAKYDCPVRYDIRHGMRVKTENVNA
jgi:hypothetical protein